MENNSSGTKIIVGAFFALFGILLTLDNLEVVDAGLYLRFWPMVLIAIGVMKMMEPGRKIIALILLIAGVALLADNIHWIRFSIFDLWPVVLIVAGLLVVGNAVGFKPANVITRGSTIFAVFSQQNVMLDAPATTERRAIAFMGGCEIDLPEPQRDLPPVVIETVAVWGGVEIRVPDGWGVQGEVFPMMGGFEVNVPSLARPARLLIVRGLALMGGVVVKRRNS